jgi:hypothetical protein
MKTPNIFDNLQRVAERASGDIRSVSDSLQSLAALLGNSPEDSLIRLSLKQQADRLDATATMLIIESQLGNPKSSGWIAKVGKSAAGVAFILASSAAAAIGTDAGNSAYHHFAERHTAVVQSINTVIVEANSASVELLNHLNDEESRIRRSLNEIASNNYSLDHHPATHDIADPKFVSNPPADLENRVRNLMVATGQILFAVGPTEGYDPTIPEHIQMLRDAENALGLRQEVFEIEALRIELSTG